jgi:hypothetical protein
MININMISLILICYNELRVFISNQDWFAFMLTTNQFKYINKSTRFIKLNRRYSRLYWRSPDFRNIVHSKIINPTKQLGVNLNNYIITDNNTIGALSDDLDFHTLSVRYSNVNNLSSCKNIKKLDLTGCRYIDDLSPLEKIQDITLSYCKYIKDLSPLKNAEQVILSHCINITDISPLKNVKRVFISYCDNIKDLTPLKNIYFLYLSACNSKIDVSELYNIKIINIVLCKNIIGTSELKNKKKTNLFIY